jgi:hypothetical protein
MQQKAFQFQVMRITDGGNKLIPVGKPVVISSDCEDQARQLAAKAKLEGRHKKPSSYHKFLVTQADPSISYVNQYMPYEWLVVPATLVH